jgi:uncharacterized protein (TIGR02996 family)
MGQPREEPPVSDLCALFDAVQANFDDPLARGVLADWLDDLGDVRGGLVRASRGVAAALAEWDVLRAQRDGYPYGMGEPAPELEDETDDPDRSIARRNQQRQAEYWDRVQECRAALDDRLRACGGVPRGGGAAHGVLRSVGPSHAPRTRVVGFDFETFCGFVDTLHARTSLLAPPARSPPDRLRAPDPHPVRRCGFRR